MQNHLPNDNNPQGMEWGNRTSTSGVDLQRSRQQSSGVQVTTQDFTGDGTEDIRIENNEIFLLFKSEDLSTRRLLSEAGRQGGSNLLGGAIETRPTLRHDNHHHRPEFQTVNTYEVVEDGGTVGSFRTRREYTYHDEPIAIIADVRLYTGDKFFLVDLTYKNIGRESLILDQDPSHIHDGIQLFNSLGLAGRSDDDPDYRFHLADDGTRAFANTSKWQTFDGTERATIFDSQDALTYGQLAGATGPKMWIEEPAHLDFLVEELRLDPDESISYTNVFGFHAGGADAPTTGSQMYSEARNRSQGEIPTPETTPTPTKTAPPTPTTETTPVTETTSPTTSSSIPYDLQGGTKTEVTIGDTRFYVISDIPDTDSNRLAVTTPDYDVVAGPETRQALVIHTYQNEFEYLPVFGKQARKVSIQQAKQKAAEWRLAELAARAGDIAADLLAAWAGAHAGLKTYAYTEVLEALESAMDWGADWAGQPYKRRFTELLMACRNVEWMRQETKNVHDLTTDAAGVAALLGKLVEAYDHYKTIRNVTEAFQLLHKSAQTTGPVSDLLFVEGDHKVAKAARGMLLSFAIKTSFGQLDDFFEVTAEVDGIMHAYHTIERSLQKRFLEIENAARDETLTPAHIYEFEMMDFTRHQLRAMAFHFAAERMKGLANDDLSLLWNAMVNAQENVNQYREITDTQVWLGKTSLLTWGAREKGVRTAVNDSINMELQEGSS